MGDLTLVTAHSRADLKNQAWQSADLVRLHGLVDGGIYAPESIRWSAAVRPRVSWEHMVRSPLVARELNKSTSKVGVMGYEIRIDDFSESIYSHFKTLYQQTVVTKERYQQVNIFDQSLSKAKAGFRTVLLGIWKAQTLCAGLVMYHKKHDLYVSLGAKQKIKGMPGGLGGILEQQVWLYALDRDIQAIYHGISPNPAGFYASTGLFEFKARHGYTAYPQGRWFTYFLLNHKNWLSEPIFLTIHQQQLQYLILSEAPLSELYKRYHTKEITELRCCKPAEMIKRHARTLKQLMTTS